MSSNDGGKRYIMETSGKPKDVTLIFLKILRKAGNWKFYAGFGENNKIFLLVCQELKHFGIMKFIRIISP